MTATLHDLAGATSVTSEPILDFDVIKARVADILEIAPADVTDIVLGKFFGHARETMNRLRSGAMKPSLPAALAMAQKLDMSVEAITNSNASQPGPSTPLPPSGPKGN